MCLAVPALIKSIRGDAAVVELGGVERQISLLLTPEAHEGDYAIVHAGFAISLLDEAEAKETLALLRQLAEGVDAGEP
jgi:hydrogenase expression/formation protein HypC